MHLFPHFWHNFLMCLFFFFFFSPFETVPVPPTASCLTTDCRASSPFLLIGQIFLRKPSSGSSVNLRLLRHEPGSGSSTNCNEAVFGVQNASLDMLWELSVQFDEPRIWLVETWKLSFGKGGEKNKQTRTAKHGWRCKVFSVSRFGGNGLICGVVGGAALLVVPAGSPSRGGDVAVFVFDINQPSLHTPFYSVLVSGDGFFFACEDFGSMFDDSFPACAFFFFFLVEITSRTLVPLFRPRSVHSGSARWDDCDRVVPHELHVSSLPDRFPHYSWTTA